MATKYHQITLKDAFSDCQNIFREDIPSFFQLLNNTIDISEFIPADFYLAFYQTLGRKRIYPLEGSLKDEFPFCKALIPYNVHNESSLPEVSYNLYGYPTCPNDSSLAMQRLGHCHEKGKTDREKWGCPKVHMVEGQYICDCKEPYNTAKKGRITYTYENMGFRKFLGTQQNSDEWISFYKIRTIVEQAINHLKINMCISGQKSRHHVATKTDVFLAGITSQPTVVVAHWLSYPHSG